MGWDEGGRESPRGECKSGSRGEGKGCPLCMCIKPINRCDDVCMFHPSERMHRQPVATLIGGRVNHNDS